MSKQLPSVFKEVTSGFCKMNYSYAILSSYCGCECRDHDVDVVIRSQDDVINQSLTFQAYLKYQL